METAVDIEVRLAQVEEHVAAMQRELETLREELRALAHLVGRREIVPKDPA